MNAELERERERTPQWVQEHCFEYGANRMHSMTMSKSLIRCERNNTASRRKKKPKSSRRMTKLPQKYITRAYYCVMDGKPTNCFNNVRKINMAHYISYTRAHTLFHRPAFLVRHAVHVLRWMRMLKTSSPLKSNIFMWPSLTWTWNKLTAFKLTSNHNK